MRKRINKKTTATTKKKKKKRDGFFNTKAWRELRYEVLKENQGSCSLCGRKAGDILENGKRAKITVDHCLPRSKYKELELFKPNLRCLCDECNTGKDSKVEDEFLFILELYNKENGDN